ncbi:hypothetical protein RclHR1_08240013 [Rhizophagus clarus]|uniref:Uncharacterized protein n=1 Tax=Rhizophagus clarus TaxID=94130 RepID=A0A2Z6S6R2_9GLOM|nr:hypothetical protein RclHR1_08240013 [Rhizophagus clarus]
MMKVYTISKKLAVTHFIRRSGTPIQSGLGLELYFEVDQAQNSISKVQQTFNFEGRTLCEVKIFDSRFEGLECYETLKFGSFPDAFRVGYGILKICSFQMPPERNNASTAFWIHHRRNFEGLQLPNTTGLNFEDLASERNLKGPRLPESNGQNFRGLWLYSASWT